MLMIHPSDEMYGADRVLLATAEALADDHDLTVWLPDDERYRDRPLSDALQRLGCTVRQVALPVLRRRELNPGGLLALARRLRAVRQRILSAAPGIVLISTSALAPAILVVPRRIRVVVHVHEVLSRAEGLVLGLLMIRAQTIVAPSEAVRRHLPSPLRRRCVVVPNGTPEPRQRESGPTDGLVRLVVASRWGANKGHDLLLEAWARLVRTDLRLVVLGGPPPTGRGVDVTGLVERLPNRDTVSIVGEVEDSGGHIWDGDAVLMPSTAPESFGLVAIEGFARGKPAIATNLGGCAEIVDESCGWLLPADAEAWRDLLESLDVEEVRRRGRAGRQRYESLYSDSAFRTRIVEAIEGTD